MSVIAIYNNGDRIICQSDGMSWHYQTNEVVTRERSKIYRVNNRCAVLNVGAYGELWEFFARDIHEVDPAAASGGPEAIATEFAEAIRLWLDLKGITDPREFMTFFVGFNDQKQPECWQLFNGSERAEKYGFDGRNEDLKPVKRKFETGDIISIGMGLPETEFEAHFRELQDRDTQTALSLAFRRTVQALPENAAGGRLFMEILKHTPG